MPNYRRNRIPGAAYFFIVNLRQRRSGLLVTQADALREAVREVRRQSPFRIDAWVVLSDHVHCLWTLPEGDSKRRADANPPSCDSRCSAVQWEHGANVGVLHRTARHNYEGGGLHPPYVDNLPKRA